MSNDTESASFAHNKNQLIAIFVSYAFFALVFGLAYRYVINPDGISQLRLAGYIAEGNFLRSVVSGWSPLLAWFMAPFLFLGFDGLIAARITIAICGGGLLLGCWFLTLRYDLSLNVRCISMMIAALLIAVWTIQCIASDVLVAALIICYIYFVTAPDILDKKKRPLFCGIIGGLSYLAHHYAFPFFIVHFPVILLLRGYIDRNTEGLPTKKVLSAWVVGMAGFCIIASLWVSVVSFKYDELRISSKGGVAHAVMGPKDVDRRHPFFIAGLYKPRDSYAMHVFEDVSDVKFLTWSPFESKEYFIHQLRVIKDNIVYIYNHFVGQSPFFTYAFVICIIALVPVVLLLKPLNRRTKFLYSWTVLTFFIYCSGFIILIARSPRRFYAMMLVFLLLSVHFLQELFNNIKDNLSEVNKKCLAFYLVVIVVLAFALKPGIQLLKSAKYVITHEQVNAYREIADQIKPIQFPSPYAIIRSSQKPHTDTFIAYYLGKQLLGRPISRDPDGITKELREADAKSLLVFDNYDIVEKLRQDDRYVQIASKHLEDSKRYEHTVNMNIRDHEIVSGWDNDVHVFILK